MSDVRHVLDKYGVELPKPSARAQMLAIEVSRIEVLESHSLQHAIQNLDVLSGVSVAKSMQRKSALLGLDQPLAVRMDLSAVVEPHPETSTDYLRRVLGELKGMCSRDGQEPADNICQRSTVLGSGRVLRRQCPPNSGHNPLITPGQVLTVTS
jgi:hypothetical protein